MRKLRRALLSVFDKRGLLELAAALHSLGIELLSTGGTAEVLRGAGIPFIPVASYTGAPEILEGRVKTLHPRIHGGLLGRPTAAHEQEMREQGIPPIDLVAINLYPFEGTIARPDVTFAQAIENIDIGGPAMIRSAAKNHERVAVVVGPDDYPALVEELQRSGGSLADETRFRLAVRAFAYTAAYDGAIAAYLSGLAGTPRMSDGGPAGEPAIFPAFLTVQAHLAQRLRYGENPHQQAAFYRIGAQPAEPTIGFAEVLQGKELSYNNLLDLDAALELSREFARPAAIVVKHTNPSGVATAESVALAYRRARATDPISAFGGIVALNRPVDAELARELTETFLEAVVAPDYEAAALELLATKKNLRVLRARGGDPTARVPLAGLAVRTIGGGWLVQSRDEPSLEGIEEEVAGARIATRRAPSEEERAGLALAWRVAKHVKSNAIVLAERQGTLGIGAGQMSRVDAVRLAVGKAVLPLVGSVLASDAFFPFRDGLDLAAKAGVTAVIQPGGSVRDEEVIAAADETGIAMLLTGRRHFRH